MALKSKQKLSTKIQIEEDNSKEEMEIDHGFNLFDSSLFYLKT